MRYTSIDILRTIGIIVMVLVHFSENLAGATPRFAGLGAPVFAFISGISYFLWAQGQQARGKSELDISKTSVRRGLFVIGLGFLFNILVWLPEDTFTWDVLTFIGTALLVLNLARNIPIPVLVVGAILALGISPILRALAEYPLYWENGYFDPDLTLSDLAIGFLACGYFPFFPWIAYSLIGFVTASLVFGRHEAEKTYAGKVVMAGGLLMAIAATALLTRGFMPTMVSQKLVEGWTMFPPTIPYVLGTLGMGIFLFGITHRFVDLNPQAAKYRGLLDITKTFSRYSLTIYVLHHVVHLWPLWIYAVVQGYEPTYFWQKVMTTTPALGLAVLFLAICYFVLRWIGPDERYGIESWMRWVCD